MTRPFLSVVIPSRNDARRLPLTLIDIDRHLTSVPYSYEILVVDDASSDATSEIVRRFIPVVKNLKLIVSAEQRGAGAALRIGMLAAKGSWRLVFDANNRISIVEFSKVLPQLTADRSVDVVAGAALASTRGMLAAHLMNPRRSIAGLANGALRVLLGSTIRDFTTGFHCFSEEAADKIFQITKLDNPAASIETLVLGERFGYAVRMVPVAVHGAADAGNSSRYLQMLFEAIKIRWWLSRKRYLFSVDR